MYNVKVEPAFQEHETAEEYDDDTFLMVEGEFHAALKKYLKAGAGSANVEEAVANVLSGDV